MVSLSISISISRGVMDSPLFILDDPLNDPFIDAIAASSDVDDPVLEVLRLDGARGSHGSAYATAFFSTNGTRSYSLLLLLLLLFVIVSEAGGSAYPDRPINPLISLKRRLLSVPST